MILEVLDDCHSRRCKDSGSGPSVHCCNTTLSVTSKSSWCEIMFQAYALLQRSTWRFLKRAWSRLGQPKSVTSKLLEYKRDDWQYHAKGIWWLSSHFDIYLPERLPFALSRSTNEAFQCAVCETVLITPKLRLQALFVVYVNFQGRWLFHCKGGTASHCCSATGLWT